MILGIDEVGRGVWAGPLVVGAVVLGEAKIEGLTDSKALSAKKREAFDVEIRDQAAAIGLGWVSASEIDDIGLGPALYLATRRAVEEVQATGASFHEIIIDGTINLLKGTTLEQYVTTMKKADLLIGSVSAASIVAKVARDRYMTEQEAVYPGYHFASHVGYGTAAHRQAIDQLGVTPLHRLSIAPLAKYRSEVSGDQTLPRHTPSRRKILSKLSSFSAGHASARQSSKSEESLTKISGLSHNATETSDHPTTRAIDDAGDLQPTTRAIGDASESVAAEELVRRGHEILERNWKTKYCEIDIVSRKDDTYYFTEVKHRRNDTAGDGLAAITPRKLNQMRYAARFYAHAMKLANFDLRLIAVSTTGEIPKVDVFIDDTY